MVGWSYTAFPLTPALSLRERESPRQRVGEAGASGLFERWSEALPPHEGKGRGERAQSVVWLEAE
jgi:hypothetical protein